MSLRRRLSILVAIGLMPPFLLTVFNAARWQIHMEDQARLDAVSDARLISTAVGQLIDSSRQLMLAMSKYSVTSGNDAECTTYFKTAITDLPMYRGAAVIDTDGKFHCSTIPIPPGLDVRDRVYFHEPLATGKFTIGTYTKGRVTDSTSIHLSMPYRSPDGSLSGVIVLILNPDKMTDSLAALPRRMQDRVMVLDRKGSLVSTFPRDQSKDAETIVQAVNSKSVPASAAIIDINVLPHRPQIIAFAPVGERPEGFSVMVAADQKRAMAAAWIFTARELAISIATIVLAIGGAWIATHYVIVRPIRAMVEVARRRERGDATARFPTFGQMTEFGELSSSLSRMSAKVDELLAQKALLLRELQHRVMNSLNLLSSIFDIQARQQMTTATTREQLRRARNRVVAMGTVYRYLYNASAVDDIEISELLRAICKESENAYEGPVKLSIQVEAEPLVLSGTNAIGLAMLTHELITNAVKHAYSEGEPGPISVSLKRLDGGGFEYRLADRGRGLPSDFQIEKSDSLGMIMILATTHQLGGKLTINQLNPGTEFVIELPPSIQQSKVA
ncbi:MAG TPA: histidine kinase dimerization/phosphoacceptor domain -containing protein [Pseudolabrys sp.]